MNKILTKQRIENLNKFRNLMKEAVSHMIEEEKNPAVKAAYERTLKNIESVPINFFPKKNLVHAIYKIGKQIFTSEVLGEHKQEIIVMKKGKQTFVIRGKRNIDIPSEHFFHENNLNWQGIHTLMHEYCHDPARNVLKFSNQIHLNSEQAEELIADLLSAKIARKMGMNKERVLSFYRGRQGVYGKFPFKETLEKAIKPKKGKIEPITPKRPFRELAKRKKSRKITSIYMRRKAA